MNTTSHTYNLRLLACLLYFIFNSCQHPESSKLPIYDVSDFDSRLVNDDLDTNEDHRIKSFNLINQNGKPIDQEAYRNKIYIADFFFARCLSICPVMTGNMKKLQDEFAETDEIKLLSISVTPKIDSVPILKAYAKKHQANAEKWNICTGDKEHIYDLAGAVFSPQQKMETENYRISSILQILPL